LIFSTLNELVYKTFKLKLAVNALTFQSNISYVLQSIAK